MASQTVQSQPTTGTEGRVSRPSLPSRAYLASIVESSEDAIIGKDLDGVVVSWNPAAERLYGYAPDEIIGREISILMPPERSDESARIMERLRRGERVEHYETVRLRKDGARLDISVTISPIRDDAGLIVGASAIARDITDQKRSELRLRFLAETGAQLSESLDVQATLAAVAQMATRTVADCALVVLIGDDGEPRHQAFAHRQPAGEALLRELGRRYPPRPDDGSPFWQAIKRGQSVVVPEIGEPELVRLTRDPEQLRLLRELRLASALYLPLVAHGRTLGVISLLTADSDRRLGEADRAVGEEVARRVALALDNARLYREAREAIRTRDEFLSIASHEIRTPVAALSGVAQLLQRARRRGVLDEARLDRALEQIAHSSRRLASLTEDLLDVSRLQTGHFELHVRLLDAVAFTRELVEQYRERLDERHRLEFTSPPVVCSVAADPVRLEQVLDNLIGNAVKYSPNGGPIEIQLQPDEAGLQLQIRDQGIGLPPGTGDAIFHPFGRMANAVQHQIQGLGLGLYICRRIVERHGGRLWAESPGEDQGTTLHLWLPCAEPGASGD